MCHLADSPGRIHAYSYGEADFRVIGGQLALENEDFKGIPRQEHGAEAHSFDNLAREVAEGTISRDRVLKLIGAAFLGGLGALIGSLLLTDIEVEPLARKYPLKQCSQLFGRVLVGVRPPVSP